MTGKLLYPILKPHYLEQGHTKVVYLNYQENFKNGTVPSRAPDTMRRLPRGRLQEFAVQKAPQSNSDEHAGLGITMYLKTIVLNHKLE